MAISRQFVQALRLERDRVDDFDAYPYCIPAIRNLDRIEFHPAVTFLTGENGSGKSTLIEALAVRYGFNPEGGSKNHFFESRPTHSDLHRNLTLERGAAYATDGYFLRAESFYNLATEIENLDSFRGAVPPIGPAYGGASLHEQSHGQAFFSLMMNRLTGNGFYIFDEPEAALSPQRQLSALTLIDDLVRERSQLVIATHSPILMAYPDATIYVLSERGIRVTPYEETEHYQITRAFMDHRETMLRELLGRLPLD